MLGSVASRPAKAQLHHIENDKPVFRVGDWRVRIDGPNEASYWRDYPGTTDPRRTLPNLSIEDGTIKLPIEDLVNLILERAEPAELAKSLWSDDSVKERFIHCLTNHWSGGNVTPGDRRRVLDEVQEAVRADAVYKLTSELSKKEHDLSVRHEIFDWIDRVLDRVREIKDVWYEGRPDLIDRIKNLENDLQARADLTRPRWAGSELTRIGGTTWNEARDAWRKRVEELFS